MSSLLARLPIFLPATLVFLVAAEIAADARGGDAPTAVREGEPLSSRFLREAPLAWAEYEKFLGRLQGRLTARLVVSDGEKLHVAFEIKQNEQCQLCTTQRKSWPTNDKPTLGEVFTWNPDYAFTLQRPAESNPWFISRVALASEPPPPALVEGAKPRRAFQAVKDEVQDRFRASRFLLMLHGGVSLSQLTQMPSFRVVSASQVVDDGVPAIQIQFDNPHPLEQPPFVPIQRGTMTLDPQASWCLRSADMEYLYASGPKRVRVRTAYKTAGSPLPLPVSAVTTGEPTGSSAGAAGSYRHEFQAELHEPQQLPANDAFTLTAFGFREPEQLRTGGSWLFLWLGAIGLVCVIAGLWLRRRLRAGAALPPVRAPR
ncbi:MAG: hypothetical protein HYS13_02960 [Planctomycetia bacterium]|nr:hypothetical protein [Planctomycetia bacterium]